MLVLSGFVGSRVKVDGPAEVEFLGIRGNRIRYGVHAPDTTHILRDDAKDTTPKETETK